MSAPAVAPEFERFIARLADESAEVIRPFFFNPDLAIDLKADRTIVTLADRNAEERLRDLIHKEYPRHGIIGEEFGNENSDAEFVWVLDPIDGTIAFSRSCPLFGTLIGLLHEGKPVLGCINQPILRQMCVGNNVETRINGRVVRCSAVNRLEDALLLTGDLSNIAMMQDGPAFDRLRQRVRMFRTWGDCYGYLLVACGQADAMCDPILSPWDLLPLIPVVRGAGGIITGWKGDDAQASGTCIAAAPGIHGLLLEALTASPA